MTIKLKILCFALIAVLVPFAVLGYFAYSHSVRINQARFGQELHSLGALVADQIDRRIQRLSADVEAFAASPLLYKAIAREPAALLQTQAYFTSLRARLADYRSLSLEDTQGVSIGAEGADRSRWPVRKAGVDVVLGKGAEPLLRVAVPVMDTSGAESGYLVAALHLRVLRPLLAGVAGKSLYLASSKSRLLDAAGAMPFPSPIESGAQSPVPDLEGVMLYPDHRGAGVLGVTVPTRVDGLSLLAEIDAEGAFAELERLKTRVLCILAAVLAVLMAAAYLFGASLVRPINGLIGGARRVAIGDLDVDLPSNRRDEIGYLSRVFNDMVERLQESREAVAAAQARLLEQNQRLEELSVTDNLTGLANRRGLNASLVQQLAGYRRNGRPFSVLMLDLDHFKSVNDRYGHLAGLMRKRNIHYPVETMKHQLN